MLTEGMKLKCHTDLIMKANAITGKTYRVIDETDHEIIFQNEFDQIHYLSKDPSDEAYYGNWFEMEEGDGE